MVDIHSLVRCCYYFAILFSEVWLVAGGGVILVILVVFCSLSYLLRTPCREMVQQGVRGLACDFSAIMLIS